MSIGVSNPREGKSERLRKLLSFDVGVVVQRTHACEPRSQSVLHCNPTRCLLCSLCCNETMLGDGATYGAHLEFFNYYL